MEEIETTENRVAGKIVGIEITETTTGEQDLQGKPYCAYLNTIFQDNLTYKVKSYSL